MSIRRLIIDILIPYHPELIEYAQRISNLNDTDGVALQIVEHDERTKTIEMTIEGEDLSFDSIKEIVEELGGSVHSLDLVSAGSRIVESCTKHQGKI